MRISKYHDMNKEDILAIMSRNNEMSGEINDRVKAIIDEVKTGGDQSLIAHTPEEDGHIESYFGRFKDDYIYTMEGSHMRVQGISGGSWLRHCDLDPLPSDSFPSSLE